MKTAMDAETEAIFDAVIDALAHPDAEKVRDAMRELLAAAEEVEDVRTLQERNGPLTDTCADVADEVIQARTDEMEERAADIAKQVLSSLSRIEIDRDLV